MTDDLDKMALGMKRFQARGGTHLFFREALGIPEKHIWPKMDEIMFSVEDHDKTAVKAGHSVSKTFSVSGIALSFLYSWIPSTVITTAPTNKQVEDVLWREIRSKWQNSKIAFPGNLTTSSLDMQKETGLRWFATGFSTRPDTVTAQATAFQGYHNEHLLVIFDEAAGILPQIWRAAMSLIAGGGKIIAIGNPTSNYGEFPDCFGADSGWNQITISCHDTPNFKEDKQIIPGVAGREYERYIIKKYGEGSNEHRIRILGEFPDYAEGTYYGIQLARAKKEGRLKCSALLDETARVHTFWDIGHSHTAIWFVQFIRDQINMIDFYEDNQGLGLPAYAQVLKVKPYRYGDHYAPHDIAQSNAKSFQTGKVTLDVAAELGIGFKVAERTSFDDGVEAVRGLFNKLHFGDVKRGLRLLGNYKRKKNESLSNEDRAIYYKEPLKNGSEHCADALRTMAVAFRYNLISSERLGSLTPYAREVQKEYDLMVD